MMSRCYQLAFVLLFANSSLAQESKSDTESKETKRWMEFYRVVASEYELKAPSISDMQLDSSSEPLFTFYYPSHFRKPHGAFYVWTHQKRPHVVGCLWSQLEQDGRRTLVHELHSLSTSTVIGTWQNKFQWKPDSAGLEFLSVPDVGPAPISSASQKTQLRAIARRFSGTSHREEDRRLTILPHPLYQYEIQDAQDSPTGDVRNGALFGLFDERDAEILILIEAQLHETELQWMVAPVRFSDAPISLKCSDVDFWKQPALGYDDSTKPYYSPRPTMYNASLNEVVLPTDRK
jgi:hypothetical protein